MVDQDHGKYNDIFIFISEKRQVVRIAEGSGDNLLREDIEDGYVDYIYHAQHELNVDMPEVDGGMVLLEKPLREKYRCMADCIPDVLVMAYGSYIAGCIVLM